MIPLSISFLKSQPTIADLNKVVKEAQSPIKLQLDTARGDKFVEQDFNVPNVNCQTPRTSDLLSKININNCKNTETFKGDVIRSMGIEVL